MSPKAAAAAVLNASAVQALRDASLTGDPFAFCVTLPLGSGGTIKLDVNVPHPDKLDTMTATWLAGLVRMVEDRATEEAKVRRCKEPGCDTILSNYNKSEWCSLHERNHSTGRIPRKR